MFSSESFVTLPNCGHSALMFCAVRRRLLFPQRNRNIIKRAPAATLPCKRNSNDSGKLQSSCEPVRVPLLRWLPARCHPRPVLPRPGTAGADGDRSRRQMVGSSLSNVGNRGAPRCPSLIKGDSTKHGGEGTGAASTHAVPGRLPALSRRRQQAPVASAARGEQRPVARLRSAARLS